MPQPFFLSQDHHHRLRGFNLWSSALVLPIYTPLHRLCLWRTLRYCRIWFLTIPGSLCHAFELLRFPWADFDIGKSHTFLLFSAVSIPGWIPRTLSSMLIMFGEQARVCGSWHILAMAMNWKSIIMIFSFGEYNWSGEVEGGCCAIEDEIFSLWAENWIVWWYPSVDTRDRISVRPAGWGFCLELSLFVCVFC